MLGIKLFERIYKAYNSGVKHLLKVDILRKSPRETMHNLLDKRQIAPYEILLLIGIYLSIGFHR
jgi:hypothetical protein